MLSYKPFWRTLEKSKESQYTLIKRHKISASIIFRLKHDYRISLKTINRLCCILNCDVSDIVLYIRE